MESIKILLLAARIVCYEVGDFFSKIYVSWGGAHA